MFQHANIRTPKWVGYLVQRPESHGIHHARGVHRYNYTDLPLWDLVFGTFRNPDVYEGDCRPHDRRVDREASEVPNTDWVTESAGA